MNQMMNQSQHAILRARWTADASQGRTSTVLNRDPDGLMTHDDSFVGAALTAWPLWAGDSCCTWPHSLLTQLM
jgi:hypothetical protein